MQPSKPVAAPARHGVAQIVLESLLPQLDHPFDYAIPPHLAGEVRPGVRVRVPLRHGTRSTAGFVLAVSDETRHAGELREVDGVVSPLPVLAPEVWRLARAVADRGAGTAADVLRLAVPARAARVENAWVPEEHAKPGELPDPWTAPGYAPGFFDGLLDGGTRAALSVAPGVWPRPGADARSDRPWLRSWALTLAAAAIACLRRDATAILALPDRRDVDEAEEALASLGAAAWTARLDTAGSNADRYRAFLGCLAGPRIVIGNRSALYAPAGRLGMIAVWDDGDPGHAEPRAPYAHSRDIALLRQEQQSCALLFAAHGRSTDVHRLVVLGWLAPTGPERLPHPAVVVTARQAGDERDSRIPAAAYSAAHRGLEGGPVLLQVARPGYVPVLSCRDCREPALCPHCQGPLGLDTPEAAPSCRRCGREAHGWTCPFCQGSAVRMIQVGTTRTAEELGRAFPGVPVVVADGTHPVARVASRPALVVATRGAEPIADAGYRAILLLDGPSMLRREALRVGEDCLRAWSNAAALAAPGAPVVLAGVSGPIAQALATWRQDRYAERELADRTALHLPPAVRIATVTGESAAVEAALDTLREAPVIDVLGPVPFEGRSRATVRFAYRHGAEVARLLRAVLVRRSTGRRAQTRGGTPPTLKVRFDDPEAL